MKKIIYQYISIFLGLYTISVGNMFYEEFFLNNSIEIGIYSGFIFYGAIDLVIGLFLLASLYVYFNFILKIELKYTYTYLLIFFITLFYFIFLHIFDNENPIYIFLFYILGFLLYGIILKLIKKIS